MRVTPEMTTEGGQPLSQLADILDEDGAGVQVTVTRMGNVKLSVDSAAIPSKSVHLTAEDAENLADLLRLRAHAARRAQ